MKLLLKAALPLALAAVLALAACGTPETGPASATSQPPAGASASLGPGVSSADAKSYHPVWLTPAVSGDQVALSLAEVLKDRMAHFWVNLPSGKESFMAYRLDGVTYVRANICVPCRSTSFSLEKGVLVCDTCGTRFDAKTGAGLSGACKAFPKDEARATVADDRLVVTTTALAAAYASTLQAG